VIPLIERKSALLMADVYPVQTSAGVRRRPRVRPSARVVTDLVIVAYGAPWACSARFFTHPS
jgi:hypothetical protein